jgi:hypothetical protein
MADPISTCMGTEPINLAITHTPKKEQQPAIFLFYNKAFRENNTFSVHIFKLDLLYTLYEKRGYFMDFLCVLYIIQRMKFLINQTAGKVFFFFKAGPQLYPASN